MKNILHALAVILLFFTGCSKPLLKGEGHLTSETRTVSGFTSVRVNGSNNVRIIHSDAFRVIISGYGNLIPVYETRLNGSELVLEYERNVRNVRNDNISLEIYMPLLTSVEVNGSSDINVTEGFHSDSDFSAEISGSGSVRIMDGSCNKARYKISGSGDIRAFNMLSHSADAHISGSGNIEVATLGKLKARISGSGNIYYTGNPEDVEVHVSGSGKVIRK